MPFNRPQRKGVWAPDPKGNALGRILGGIAAAAAASLRSGETLVQSVARSYEKEQVLEKDLITAPFRHLL